VKTGDFDAWYGVRAEAQAMADAEMRERHLDDKPTEQITLTLGKSTPEEQKLAQQRIQERDQELLGIIDEKMQIAASPREWQFAKDLERLWRQAIWITMINQFPDGKPLSSQLVHDVDVWEIFIGAINRRMAGGESIGSSGSDEEFYATAQDRSSNSDKA